MTVSRAFWKIVLKNIGTIITYTIILVMFGSLNMDSGSTVPQYEATKPNVAIFNHDGKRAVTKSFVKYLEENNEIKTGYDDEERLKDALFYDDVSVAVEIPEGFSQDMMLGKNPEVKLRSSSGYAAELAKVSIRRYLTIADGYSKLNLSENDLASRIDKALKTSTKVEVSTTVDTSKYSRATRYFSFANYSILACVITIICLIMSSFNRAPVRKRNLVSAIELKRMNFVLLRNSCIYSALVWLFYIIIGFFVVGFAELWSIHGALYALNSLIFCVCATTIAYLISRFIENTDAVNGVMNIVAIGSSFLCGAFVPAAYLPDSVLAFAHVLPSYYYIDANNKIMELENYDISSLWPVLLNIGIVAIFSIVFVIVANIVSHKRQKIA